MEKLKIVLEYLSKELLELNKQRNKLQVKTWVDMAKLHTLDSKIENVKKHYLI